MKHLVFLTLLLGCYLAQGQNNTGKISGHVTGLREQIAEVSVLVKGTKLGTHTDTHGNFSLKIPAGNYTLSVQHTAYQGI